MWALSRAVNQVVLRLDTTEELTQATIETCPPSTPRPPLDRLLEIPGIRSVDLHRYRARVNLLPGADRERITRRVCQVLSQPWGPACSKPPEASPRSFRVAYQGARRVGESLRMAGPQPVLRALFGVRGVSEAILEPGRVQVRLGRLFSWADVEEDVKRALEVAG